MNRSRGPNQGGSRLASERDLRFTDEHIAEFAAASGDLNPLHLDPVFARRTPFGCCIVQGSLVALALLGCLSDEALAEARYVRAWFAGGVVPGSRVRADFEPVPEGWEVRLTGRGKVLARVRVGGKHDLIGAVSRDTGAGDVRPMRTEPALVASSDLHAGDESTGHYRPGPELAEVARRWGVERLEPGLLEGVAWASYVVGMELPGLYGLFTGVSLSTVPPVDAAEIGRQWLRVGERDERTGRLLVEGTLIGHSGSQTNARIESFIREPVASPDAAILAAPAPDRPVEGAVVVVGGSRGLGASLALAFVLRGYTVHVAFSTSVDAAAELRTAAGREADRLHLHQVDARDSRAFAQLADALDASATPLRGVVLNAAPPPLAMGVTADSGHALAEYVSESVQLAAVPLGTLLPLLEPEGWIVFCSSPAVSAPPREWPHYAAAKGAVEGLAHWVAASEPQLKSVVLRPPKMLTDLTNSPTGRIAAASVDEVARWVADRLSGSELPAGLTVLEPDV